MSLLLASSLDRQAYFPTKASSRTVAYRPIRKNEAPVGQRRTPDAYQATVDRASSASAPSAPEIQPATGRHLDWRQGLGALKNLTFVPTWHNTSEKIHQFFPMHTISATSETRTLDRQLLNPASLTVPGYESLDHFLQDQQVDSFALLHEGVIVQERYFGNIAPGTRHSLASITRTMTGSIVGALVEAKKLDLTSPARTWAPELVGTAWEAVTVRNLLDMRSGVSSRVMDSLKAMKEGQPGLQDWVVNLPRDGEAGGSFQYRTGDSEMLGYLCERATGESMAALWSRLLWAPMGAEHDASVMLDAHGTALCGGGLCATLGDTARYAQVLLDGGVWRTEAGDRRVLPGWYVDEMRHGDDDTQKAFGGMMIKLPLPEAMYRHQSWLLDRERGTSMLMGAGGQLVYLDPENRFACLATSHWLMPYDTQRMATWLETFPILRDRMLIARTHAAR